MLNGHNALRQLNLEAMVGHDAVHRLFVLEVINGPNNAINRIDPVSGNIELFWFVDQNSEALTVAGDRLLVTLPSYLIEYSTSGNPLRQIGTNLQNTHRLCESSLRPDSTIATVLFPLLIPP